MINTKDLHIEAEILPLFDFTYNNFSKAALVDILNGHLESKEAIINRQEILNGFLCHNKYMQGYNYSRLELIEVYDFLNSLFLKASSKNELKLELFFSQKNRHQERAKLSQLILLFEKLNSFYIQKLNIERFPNSYRNELEKIIIVFSAFNLKHYELIVRGQGLQIKHITELTTIILTELGRDKIQDFWTSYFLFEAYLSISIGIIKHGFNFPTITDSAFHLKDFYHPLLTKPVKNNFDATSNVALLTGPNMSGKSTFLKAIGLCVYLGHLGLAVPASKAELPYYSSISIAINLNDDLLNGYSHFMTELINLKSIILESGNDRNCFAVFDELFRGTNVEDASEIMLITIKGLLKFSKSMFFISTHLQRLKEIEKIKKYQLIILIVN